MPERPSYLYFYDEVDGSLIEEIELWPGEICTPPDPPEHEGYAFDHWDGLYYDVPMDEEIDIYARYTQETFLVEWVAYMADSEDFEVVKSESILKGGSSTAPALPSITGYECLDGWPFQSVSGITEETTIMAMFYETGTEYHFVKFYNGLTLLKSFRFAHNEIYAYIGYKGDFPVNPTRTDAAFTGWIGAPSATTPITEDLNIYAGFTRDYCSVNLWKAEKVASGDFEVFSTIKVPRGTTVSQLQARLPNPSALDGGTFERYSNIPSGTISGELNLYALYKPNGLCSDTVNRYVCFYMTYYQAYPWGPRLSWLDTKDWNATAPSIFEQPNHPQYSSRAKLGWSEQPTVNTNTLSVARYQDPATEFCVSFYADDVLVEAVTCPKNGTIVPPDAPDKAGYVFNHWDGNYSSVTQDEDVEAVYTQLSYHTVTFYAKDGTTVLKTQSVATGQNATPPTPPTVEGYDFSYWSGNYLNVQQDEDVTAVYVQVVTYTVTFIGKDEVTVLKTESVRQSGNATPPEPPEEEGFVFQSWNGTYTNVQQDETVYATYAVATYTVTFKGNEGQTLKTETVNYGADATAPTPPSVTGYTFFAWSKNYQVVKSNITTVALYRKTLAENVVNIYSGASLIGTIVKVLSCSITRKVDGECYMDLTTSMRFSPFLKKNYTVEVGGLVFNITRFEKKVVSGLYMNSISCEHVSYLLNDEIYNITEFSFTGTPANCLKQLLSGTPFTVGTVSYSSEITLNINKECTRREALMQLIAICGGEIVYDGYSIGIASHVGSTSRVNLMDTGKVTDIGYSTDVREGNETYTVGLSERLTLNVGDEVLLRFDPLSINVNTRIVGMEWDPYNHFEVALTLGSYVPTINDSLYELQEEVTDEILEELEEIEEEIDDLQLDFELIEANLDVLEDSIDEIDLKLDDIDTTFEDIETEFDDVWEAIESGTGSWDVQVVSSTPARFELNTIYLLTTGVY